MTREKWDIYLSDLAWKKQRTISINSAKNILLDWNKNIEEIKREFNILEGKINKQLNILQDEIRTLIHDK